MLDLNTSVRFHTFIALIVSIWLVAFLVLIAPFDASDLSLPIRIRILPPYGIISFLGYMAIVPLQGYIFKKSKKWSILQEVLIITVYNILVLFGSYAYYKTSIINGIYSFTKFTLEVYYPIFFIILPIIVFARWFLTKRSLKNHDGQITLTGENKYDVLKLYQTDLVCISSADNYVEVSYLANNELRKKLLRSTLKKIHGQQPELLKVHRSHIINPTHIKEWKSTNSLQLTKIEVPVSKNYKPDIIGLFDSPLKQ
jgi:hypothetical protein